MLTLFIIKPHACTADLQKQYSTYIATCNGLLEKLAELKLPPVKPTWADFTDAGPGVGCSNFEVRFRDAELALIHNSDHRILAYPSRENSADNEAERTNGAIGDSIVDGSTIQWEQYKKFDGLSDEEISTLLALLWKNRKNTRGRGWRKTPALALCRRNFQTNWWCTNI